MAATVYRDATAAAAAVGSRLMGLSLASGKSPGGPQRSDSRYEGRGLGKDPLLSRYVCNAAVGTDQPLALSNVLAQLTAVGSSGDEKSAKTALASALRLLFLFEQLTPDVSTKLAELLEREASDPRLLKPIGHLIGVQLSNSSAGTPTMFDPALHHRGDDAALKSVVETVKKALSVPDIDAGAQRAFLLLLATVGRGNPSARTALVSAIEGAIRASDEAAASSGSGGAASDWALQHSIFLAARAGGAATGTDSVSRASFVGLGSPDPVGARHALSLALLVAAREPSSVAVEMGNAVTEAVLAYAKANGGADVKEEEETTAKDDDSSSPITLSDPFARLHLARLCAAIVHSDARGGDVDRDGAPFWRMLCLLATRDSADIVRFGALEALAGGNEEAAEPLVGRGGGSINGGIATTTTLPTTTLPTTAFSHGGTTTNYVSTSSTVPPNNLSGRSEVAARQRSARAWRLLVRRYADPVLIPGLPGGRGRMGLLEAVGALLSLALRKADDAPRRRVALGAVCALARGCLADRSQTATSTAPSGFYATMAGGRGASPDAGELPEVQRVLRSLGSEVQALLEGALSAPERCAALQAALLLGAVGACAPLTPAKVLASGGTMGGGATTTASLPGSSWSPSLQSLACATVLECARARPAEAPALLSVAHAIVGLSPAGSDVSQLVALWEAACDGGSVSAGTSRARSATMRAVLSLLSAAPPPAASAPPASAPSSDLVRAAREAEGWASVRAAAAWWLGERAPDLCRSASGAAPRGSARVDKIVNGSSSSSLDHRPTASPLLVETIAELGRAALTGSWEMRCIAARSLGTLAARCGEPCRSKAYAVLSHATAGHGGIAPVALPILDALDRVYASQAALGALWEKNGGEASGWPASDALAVAKRTVELHRLVEARVCLVPRARYCLLGHRAARLLAEHPATADAAAFDPVPDTSVVEESTNDVTGTQLAKQKNDEVAAILSGGDTSASPSYGKFASSATTDAALLTDKNTEIEALLFGKPATDPNRAFETFGTSSTGSPSAVVASTAGALATWPEGDEEGDEESIAQQPWETEMSPRATSFGEQESANAAASKTAVVAHMFVADYAEPDELSVFEGDTVTIVEEMDGWALVQDPSGSQGLVPLSYLTMQGAAGPMRSPSHPVSRVHSRQASGAWGAERQGSLTTRSYTRTKEDLLNDVFASAAAVGAADPFAPVSPHQSVPEAYRQPSLPRNNGSVTTEDAALFGGNDYSAPAPSDALPRGASSRGQSPGAIGSRRRFGSGDWGGLLSGRLSRQEGDAGSSELLKTFSNASASHHRRSASGGGAAAASASAVGTTSPLGRPSSAESENGKLIAAPFTAEMEGELTVVPGDRVQVHSDVDGWARVVRLSDGRTGLVPSWAVGSA